MTNEVKRSLGQKTRLFLDGCCFCGLLGQIHPRSLPFSRSLGAPDPFSGRALGVSRPAQDFLETRAVTLLGFLCLSATAMETRPSVPRAAGTGSGGPGNAPSLRAMLRPAAPGAPGVRSEARRACGRPPSPGLPRWPGLRGPPFPLTQWAHPGAPGCSGEALQTPASYVLLLGPHSEPGRGLSSFRR